MATTLLQDSTAEAAGPLSAPDPRWELLQRILGSKHFAKAPLLSKFLLYVCDRALKGRQKEITEHKIGVLVFGRPESYDPGEDNIVRNYARQLRKRLAEYFADEGTEERFRIEIPRGGYVPVFLPRHEGSAGLQRAVPEFSGSEPARKPSWTWRPWRIVAALFLYSAVLCAATFYMARRPTQTQTSAGLTHKFWGELFNKDTDTFVVPADSGFGILQNLSKTRLTLADYVNGEYAKLPLGHIDTQSADDLRTQRYTSAVDLEAAAAFAQLPEIVPRRLILRFARDLRMDDLKQGNAILIGSEYSNPWNEVFRRNLNFRFDYRPQENGSWIINSDPRPGESKKYENNWDGPSHQTYAVIAFLPNLNRTGHVLLVQGLDMAATQAATEFLFRPDDLNQILEKAHQPDQTLAPFEVLLQTTSIGSNAPNGRVVASRFYTK
jgi:hypothetical protein